MSVQRQALTPIYRVVVTHVRTPMDRTSVHVMMAIVSRRTSTLAMVRMPPFNAHTQNLVDMYIIITIIIVAYTCTYIHAYSLGIHVIINVHFTTVITLYIHVCMQTSMSARKAHTTVHNFV